VWWENSKKPKKNKADDKGDGKYKQQQNKI
jgi:hypothetical protein